MWNVTLFRKEDNTLMVSAIKDGFSWNSTIKEEDIPEFVATAKQKYTEFINFHAEDDVLQSNITNLLNAE